MMMMMIVLVIIDWMCILEEYLPIENYQNEGKTIILLCGIRAELLDILELVLRDATGYKRPCQVLFLGM